MIAFHAFWCLTCNHNTAIIALYANEHAEDYDEAHYHERKTMEETIKQLKELPTQIMEREIAVAQLRRSLKDLKVELAEREIEIVTSATAKEWGSNAEERKINQSAAMSADVHYNGLSEGIETVENQLIADEIKLSFLRNSFSAAKSVAQLMSVN